ncbi:MAG TPA: glycosyltransferase family 4 protein [bacterium]|nr:glycosyltransferase family 4 protein [bacterium]
MKRNKKLKIAQIAPLWVSIPPEKYGGIERIVYYLSEELVKRGHKVTLFASGDSKTKAKLVSVYPRALKKDNIPWTDPFWNLENLSVAFRSANQFDIVHSHLDLWALFFQELTKTPVVHTFHNPLYTSSITAPERLPTRLKMFQIHRNTTFGCFISKSQRKLCPVKFPHNWVVYNGIDLSQYKFYPQGDEYFAWIARIDPYKGIENAILAAEKAGVKLLLAGRLDKSRRDYFKTKIKPHLGRKIKYVGELSQEELPEFYGRAKAILYPIEWHEPFGLIMTEAMACGTPVIAFDRGSVSEVIKDKKTGFVVPMLDKKGKKNINGIVKAIHEIETIKREDCRKWVEKKFTYQKMTDRYEEVYYKAIEIKKKIL